MYACILQLADARDFTPVTVFFCFPQNLSSTNNKLNPKITNKFDAVIRKLCACIRIGDLHSYIHEIQPQVPKGVGRGQAMKRNVTFTFRPHILAIYVYFN